jgi:hypothetical protein
VYITSFRVRYDNVPGAAADPIVQNIAIGNISFQTSIPLPVKLNSFEGRSNENGEAELAWSTAYEQDFDHFEVERSRNGNDFEKIGVVPAQGSNGNPRYFFLDNKVQSDRYHYRLRMVDTDGSFEYSQSILISFRGKGQLMAYPTIFQSGFRLAFDHPRHQKLRYSVINYQGQLLWEGTVTARSGNNQFEISPPIGTPSGSMLLRLEGHEGAIPLVMK